MLKRSKNIQTAMGVVVAMTAAALGMSIVQSYTGSGSYVSLRQMIPVGQSLEEAQILYEISRSETRDCMGGVQRTAEKLTSLPESADADTLIGCLEAYCADLNELAGAMERQEKQRDNLRCQGESQMAEWSKDVERIENVEKRTIEENRIGRARLEFTTLLREADEELAVIQATIRDGRDIELYVASLKHACRMSTTAESVRVLRNELALKAGSFRARTDDILAAWK